MVETPETIPAQVGTLVGQGQHGDLGREDGDDGGPAGELAEGAVLPSDRGE